MKPAENMEPKLRNEYPNYIYESLIWIIELMKVVHSRVVFHTSTLIDTGIATNKCRKVDIDMDRHAYRQSHRGIDGQPVVPGD